jgi:hypothetical protein
MHSNPSGFLTSRSALKPPYSNCVEEVVLGQNASQRNKRLMHRSKTQSYSILSAVRP